jgi:hypothetical protein
MKFLACGAEMRLMKAGARGDPTSEVAFERRTSNARPAHEFPATGVDRPSETPPPSTATTIAKVVENSRRRRFPTVLGPHLQARFRWCAFLLSAIVSKTLQTVFGLFLPQKGPSKPFLVVSQIASTACQKHQR